MIIIKKKVYINTKDADTSVKLLHIQINTAYSCISIQFYINIKDADNSVHLLHIQINMDYSCISMQ